MQQCSCRSPIAGVLKRRLTVFLRLPHLCLKLSELLRTAASMPLSGTAAHFESRPEACRALHLESVSCERTQGMLQLCLCTTRGSKQAWGCRLRHTTNNKVNGIQSMLRQTHVSLCVCRAVQLCCPCHLLSGCPYEIDAVAGFVQLAMPMSLSLAVSLAVPASDRARARQ